MARLIIKTRLKHTGLISIISALWDTSPFTTVKEHVYGHRYILDLPLTQLEMLNCRVDLEAKEIVLAHIHYNLAPPVFYSTNLGLGAVTCQNTLVTSRLQASLYKIITHTKLAKWVGKYYNAPNNLNTINIHCSSYKIMRKESTYDIKTFINMWMSGDTAIGRVMIQRKQRKSSDYPCCNCEDERLGNVLDFPHPDTIAIRNILLSKIIIWLKSIHTHPSITHFLNIVIHKWFSNTLYF